MNIRVGVRTALLANATIKGLVSTRAYFKNLPQNPTYPCLLLEQISSDPLNTVATVPGLSWARIRVIAWGKTYAAADELGVAVENCLNGQTFSLTGLEIGSVVADGMRDMYEPNVTAHYMTQDFKIYYTES